MEPIRTERSNFVYQGNGDDVVDLPCERTTSQPYVNVEPVQREVYSVWKPTEEEREAILGGANVKIGLLMQGRIPPVMVMTTFEREVE